MLRSIALGCVDRRSKPGDGNVGESLEDVLAAELSMGDGESASNDAGVGPVSYTHLTLPTICSV